MEGSEDQGKSTMSGMLITRGGATTLLLVALLAMITGCGGSSEARKARHVQQGQEFMAERNYTKARIEFRNALQIDPKDAQVRGLAGIASERLGEYDDAVKYYRVALAADESLIEVRARLARIYAVAGLADEAMDLLKPGLDASPDSAELLSVRAVVHEQRGDPDAGLSDAERAYQLKPRDSDVVAALAGIRWRAGNRDEAVSIVSQAIAADPDNLDLRVLSSRLLLALGRTADAERQLLEMVRLDPSKVEHRGLLAQVYIQEGKVDEAIEIIRAAVAVDPGRVETKIALGELLAAHKSFEDAMAQLEKFRAEAPRDQDLQIAIADFYLANGRSNLASSIYREIIKSAATVARATTARNRMASVELREGRVDEASKLVSEVLAENPNDADALVIRGEISMQRGDPSAAVSDLRSAFANQSDSVPLAISLARAQLAADQPELAEQTLRTVVQTNPRNVEARFALAQFLIETGREKQARPVLEQLVNEQPGNSTALEGLTRLQLAGQDLAAALSTARTIQTLQPRSATGYLLEGEALRAQEKLDAARQAYERAAVVDPSAVEPVVALTRLDVSAGKLDVALARLDEQLGKFPSQAMLQALRGDVLMTMQRPKDAAVSYTAAIKLMPGSAQPYRGLAAAMITMNQPDKAAEALESGLKATGGSRQLAVDVANLQSQTGRIEDAIKTYEAALRRNPNDNVLANNLAMLLVNERSDAASLERAGQLAERFAKSENAIFLDTYGWVAYKRGKYPDALAALEKAVAKAPSAPELRYHLGMTQLKLGMEEQARANLKTAAMAGPGYPVFEEARKALESN